ncbi:MAG: hypothetical protein FWE21_02775 [Defluviitaleaceae bacterium]|nr:hypothetical protein [Defluviitaleaceae bacterium]
MKTKIPKTITILTLLTLTMVFYACGGTEVECGYNDDDIGNYNDYKAKHDYAYISIQPTEDELRHQVSQLLIEDLELLYKDMRSNIMALSNAVYRRTQHEVGFGIDIWRSMRRIIENLETGSVQFGAGVTDFDEMLAAGSQHIVSRLNF